MSTSTFETRLIRSRHPLVHLAADRVFEAMWGQEFIKSTQTTKLEDIAGVDYYAHLRTAQAAIQCKANFAGKPSECVPFELLKPNGSPGWLYTVSPLNHWLLIPWWFHGTAILLAVACLTKLRQYIDGHPGEWGTGEWPDGAKYILIPRAWLRDAFGEDFREVSFRPLRAKNLLPEAELPFLERV